MVTVDEWDEKEEDERDKYKDALTEDDLFDPDNESDDEGKHGKH